MNNPERIILVLTYKTDPSDTDILTEKVDAEKVGDYYKLVHVPAFAPNIAYGDIVKVEYEDGEFHFNGLVEESGFSVVHVVIFESFSTESIITNLTQFGCGVNTHVAENYLVVSIPPSLNYSPIRSYLFKEESLENITFRDCLSKVHAAML